MQLVLLCLQSANGSPSGGVVLGLVPTVSAVFAGRFARRVINEFPDISLRIVESYGGHLIEWLHRGEMDLAITYGPAVDLHLQVQSIGREDIAVRLSKFVFVKVHAFEKDGCQPADLSAEEVAALFA